MKGWDSIEEQIDRLFGFEFQCLGAKVQDIDNPSLTVKKLTTSITRKVK